MVLETSEELAFFVVKVLSIAIAAVITNGVAGMAGVAMNRVQPASNQPLQDGPSASGRPLS